MSFWRTFGFHTVSTIENILDKESFTIEELLDEEELLQELKSQNKKLITFLEKPETLEQLFKYITEDPSDVEDQKFKFKYPFYASEILSSDSLGISDAIYTNESLLDKLYGFLDADPPLNPLLTSYASRVAGMLLQRKVPETVAYLKKKDDIIAKFIKHLGSASVMDLLLKLISCDGLSPESGILTWLCEANLISNLICKFSPDFDVDVHENASQALVDIIAVSTNPQTEESKEGEELLQVIPQPSILLQRLETEEVADVLFTNILADQSKSSILIHGLNVVIELCRHNTAEEVGEELPSVLAVVLRYLEPLLTILCEPHTDEIVLTTSGKEVRPFGVARL